MYSIVETQKGSKAIHFQQNLYRLQKTNKNGTASWVCTNRRCSSSLTINDEKIQKIRGKHNHSSIKRSLSILDMVNGIRQEVSENLSTPITQIYNQAVSEYVEKTTCDSFSSLISLETEKWYC